MNYVFRDKFRLLTLRFQPNIIFLTFGWFLSLRPCVNFFLPHLALGGGVEYVMLDVPRISPKFSMSVASTLRAYRRPIIDAFP